MKSLQVLTPARKCLFNCPFCIAKTHEHHNLFDNNYKDKYDFWKDNYIKILNTYTDLKTVVITGTNEPMQDQDYVEEVIKITRENRPDIQIELQTRIYKKTDIFNEIDIVAYSISDFKLLNKIDVVDKGARYVLILTNTFDNKLLKDILKEVPKKVKQITFKVLYDSKGVNAVIDEWIKNNKISLNTATNLKEEIENYNGKLSIIFDENCMEAENRYMVFREDGLLYKDFDSNKPIEL